MRFLACACQKAANFCFASPLALLLTCLPRGCRVQHHKSALLQLSSQLPLSSSTSSHLCSAASCSCEPDCHLVPHLELGLDALVGGLLLGGTSPFSIELALATWCHSNKYITCIPLYHRIKVPQFSDTSLKITTSLCSCGAPVL